MPEDPPANPAPWKVGAARRELEMDFTGLELLGWGQPAGRIRRVEAPLQVRAVVLEADGRRWVYVCAELCFITQSVRDGLRAELASRDCPLEEHELVIAATHTHSGPAGFAHALFYNLSNPGLAAGAPGLRSHGTGYDRIGAAGPAP